MITFAEKLGAKREATLDRSVRLDFSAETRMSGVDMPDGRVIRKGAVNAVSPATSPWHSAARSRPTSRARPTAWP